MLSLSRILTGHERTAKGKRRRYGCMWLMWKQLQQDFWQGYKTWRVYCPCVRLPDSCTHTYNPQWQWNQFQSLNLANRLMVLEKYQDGDIRANSLEKWRALVFVWDRGKCQLIDQVRRKTLNYLALRFENTEGTCLYWSCRVDTPTQSVLHL